MRDFFPLLSQTRAHSTSRQKVKVWKGIVEELKTTFLEPDNGHFWAGCIYGKNNDSQRFGFFCGAALEYLKVGNDETDDAGGIVPLP